MLKISINELLTDPDEYFRKAEYAGFYDWFCDTEALENRARKLLPKLKFLIAKGILNGDTHYVWFKNNCTFGGKLYDDARISTLADNRFIGGICAVSGHANTEMKACIWVLGNQSREELEEYENYSWSVLKNQINTDEELAAKLTKVFNPRGPK